MDDPSEFQKDQNALVKLTSLSVLGVGLAALFLGYEQFWLVFVLGFAVLVPMVKTLAEAVGVDESERGDPADATTPRRTERDEYDAESESKQDALDTLRERYARGDLTEAEFERKVEALLETETPESARKRVERTRHSDEGRRDRDVEETERHLETDERTG